MNFLIKYILNYGEINIYINKLYFYYYRWFIMITKKTKNIFKDVFEIGIHAKVGEGVLPYDDCDPISEMHGICKKVNKKFK